jgi:hypothetical protein
VIRIHKWATGNARKSVAAEDPLAGGGLASESLRSGAATERRRQVIVACSAAMIAQLGAKRCGSDGVQAVTRMVSYKNSGARSAPFGQVSV